MTSADFSRQALRRASEKKEHPHVRETSRGKINNLHPIYLHHLLRNVRVALGLCFVLQTRPHCISLI